MSTGRRKFRIIKEIAEGGFGKVYLAEQISADGFSRIVAVKLLHAKWSSHDEVVMRTRDEARLLGLIRHQHIVKVEDLTSIDGKCAIVMEYLEGCDLKWMMTWLKEQGHVFPRASLFEIVLASASALDAAYNGLPLQGGEPLHVIHRDIKPSNIFVTTAGGVKVLDFGTARANFAEREAKTQALAFGSQGYMAPERMLGEEDTPAADIFSLGISLYELLTLESFGRIPPRPNKFAAKVEEQIGGLPLEGDPDWVQQVKEVLFLMMSYEPDERPSAAQIVELFEELGADADDMGMRRFCRTWVSEAKSAIPEVESSDPLTGTVVDEDASQAMAVAAGTGLPETLRAPPAPSSGPPSLPPPSVVSGLAPPPSMASKPPAAAIAEEDAPTDKGSPFPQSLPAEPTLEVDPADGLEENAKGKGKVLFVVLALLVVFGLLTVVVGGSVAAYFYSDTGSGSSAPVAASPAAAPAPAPQAAGGRVVSPDSRSDVKSVPTLLKFGDPAGGRVILTGAGGFRAEWDGKEPFEVGNLAEGRYATMITPAEGSKIRGKSFQVEAGKKACEFEFDTKAKAWTGGCK
jgi:serine/threonine protein kinase